MLAPAYEKTHARKEWAPRKNGEELLRKRLPAGVVVFVLVVELESKLNLPRVIGGIAGRANFTKVLVCEVGRS